MQRVEIWPLNFPSLPLWASLQSSWVGSGSINSTVWIQISHSGELYIPGLSTPQFPPKVVYVELGEIVNYPNFKFSMNYTITNRSPRCRQFVQLNFG